jgi:gluconate 2-dehydrogenase gamma chain
MTGKLTRRGFLGATGALSTAAAFPALGQQVPDPNPPQPPASPRAYTFLSQPEARFLTAAVDRLIPPDEEWTGAAGAGVVEYLDVQLAGAYGAGYRLFLAGPWAQGTPQQGYQLPLSPAELYRAALADILRIVPERHGGRAFWDLTPEEQDAFLSELEAGRVPLPSVPSAVFFETLLANTVEGFFSDPVHGGNRDMVGWRMIGFPGAYASYVDLVEEHGLPFDRPPMSIADATRTHAHGDGFTDPLDRTHGAETPE